MNNQTIIMKITITKCQNKDVIKTGNVIKRACLSNLKTEYSKKAIKQFCTKYDPNNFKKTLKKRPFFIATINLKVVGVISISKNHLRTFFVDPKYQNKGIGRLLFFRFQKKLIKKGYKIINVNSSIFAEKIYKKLGFKTIKKQKMTDNNVSFYIIKMKKILK
jgi:N-acetylglutamate synthase-like GNAT family acetyltransferase